MAIIKRKRGNVIYVYEKTYVGFKDGKRKCKEKVIGHLDEAGNFIASKKMRGKKLEDFPAEVQKVVTVKTQIRVVETTKKVKTPRADKKQTETADVQEREKATLEKSEKYLIPVDKITQKLFNPEENKSFYDLDGVIVEVGRKNKKPVDTAVSVIFDKDKDKDISFSNDVMLDQYNNAVHSAVCSMYCAGNNIFTINALYRFMSGNSATVKAAGEKTVEEIKNSLRKMSFTRILINTENEAQKFKQIPIKVKKIERSLLHVDFITANVNGQDVEAVRILAKPPLLEYAEYKNQIASYDAKILNVPISGTKENTIIKNYLLAQILIMKNPKSKRNNIIRYDALYKNLQLEAPNEVSLRDKKRDVRGKIHIILEHWKKEGFIKGYSDDIKEGKKIAKVEIYF